MPRLMFCVPAHGRVKLAQICLTHLRHTCDELTAHGIRASAVVVSDDENLDTARDLGFGTVERDNKFVSRRFNDAIEFALDSEFNPEPADFIVPCGSDDWVDWRIFLDMPAQDTVRCFQHLSFVREDGLEMVSRRLLNQGGCGIRVYPRAVLACLGFRPADEDRHRACDTSILFNLQRAHQPTLLPIEYAEIDPHQIVDWKTAGTQLNPYRSLGAHRLLAESSDPFVALQGVYQDSFLEQMRAHYEQIRERDLVAA